MSQQAHSHTDTTQYHLVICIENCAKQCKCVTWARHIGCNKNVFSRWLFLLLLSFHFTSLFIRCWCDCRRCWFGSQCYIFLFQKIFLQYLHAFNVVFSSLSLISQRHCCSHVMRFSVYINIFLRLFSYIYYISNKQKHSIRTQAYKVFSMNKKCAKRRRRGEKTESEKKLAAIILWQRQ